MSGTTAGHSVGRHPTGGHHHGDVLLLGGRGDAAIGPLHIAKAGRNAFGARRGGGGALLGGAATPTTAAAQAATGGGGLLRLLPLRSSVERFRHLAPVIASISRSWSMMGTAIHFTAASVIVVVVIVVVGVGVGGGGAAAGAGLTGR